MITTHPIRFVSLGPGEPDLITLKGLKALQGMPIASSVPGHHDSRRQVLFTGTLHPEHSRILGHRTVFPASYGQGQDTGIKIL